MTDRPDKQASLSRLSLKVTAEKHQCRTTPGRGSVEAPIPGGGSGLSSYLKWKMRGSPLAHLEQSLRPPDLMGGRVCVHRRLMGDVSLQETCVGEAVGGKGHGWGPEGDRDGPSFGEPAGITRGNLDTKISDRSDD